MSWSYFNKFDAVTDKYLPPTGEGETMATQAVTAVCKLVYKWYNDGDVYDNTHHMRGWCNDLSTYANWLARYTGAYMLYDIEKVDSNEDYEKILMELADIVLSEVYLEELNKKEKRDSVYSCKGEFKFEEGGWDGDEEDEWEDDDEY